MADLECRPEKNNSVAWRLIENEAVLVSVESGEVIQLNEVAAEVWKLIDGTKTLRQLIEHICSEFEVDEGSAAKDVLGLIEELRGRGLVKC